MAKFTCDCDQNPFKLTSNIQVDFTPTASIVTNNKTNITDINMEYTNALKRDRWVLVMGEYSSEGIWEKDGCEGAVENLPVSKNLQQRLYNWNLKYDTIQWAYDEPEVAPDEPPDWREFSAQGLALAKEVKAALPDWTVMYSDEEKYVVSKSNGMTEKMAAKYYRYEITG